MFKARAAKPNSFKMTGSDMITRIYSHFRRKMAYYLVNHSLAGTNPHYFALKRKLLNAAGCKIGEGTKVVGPIVNTGHLEIGRNCWIGANFVVHGNGAVMLGDNIDVGPDVTFMTGTHHLVSSERRAGEGYNCDITIGSGCWLGGKSIFLNSIQVGEGCVVAAGGLVCKTISSNKLVGGVPAKIIKEL